MKVWALLRYNEDLEDVAVVGVYSAKWKLDHAEHDDLKKLAEEVQADYEGGYEEAFDSLAEYYTYERKETDFL